MRALVIGLVAAAVLAAPGCFRPDISSVACGLDGLCPTGQVCDFDTGMCRLPLPEDPDGSIEESSDAGADANADRDSDGVPNDIDNCPDVPNTMQFNEDNDVRGDPCDNCPHLANDNQADSDADAVGDLCDPRVGEQDSIVLFEGFNAPLDATWSAIGPGDWFVSEGRLRSDDDSTVASFFVNDAVVATDLYIVTEATPQTLPPPGGGANALSLTFRRNGADGVLCATYRTAADSQVRILDDPDGAAPTVLASSTAAGFSVGSTFRLQATVTGSEITCEQDVGGEPIRVMTNFLGYGNQGVGFRSRTMQVAIDYLFVVEML